MILQADSDRLRYILACLLKISVARNNEYSDFDAIKVSAHVSDEEEYASLMDY
jgi:hypothetical protein